jgi:hypothetical protein
MSPASHKSQLKSGDKIQTAAGTSIELPFAGEFPCFGQHQGWCANLAAWRMENQHLLLHWCDTCKPRIEGKSPGETWTKLAPRNPLRHGPCLCPKCHQEMRKDTERYYWCRRCQKLWELQT